MYAVGETVKWTSQANGNVTEKVGVVEAVIPPRQYLNEAQRRQVDAPCGARRDMESYLVRVPTKSGRGKGRLYWPHARLLSKVEE